MNILDTIAAKQKEYVKTITSKKKVDELKNKGRDLSYDRRNFFNSLQSSPLKPALIAEFKRQSPSKGVLGDERSPIPRVKEYEHRGAAAISVLTEQFFFRGSSEDLITARAAVSIPVMRKDFIVDEYQIFETSSWPADAILLIARLLSRHQLDDYLCICNELRLDALIEVFSHDELEWVLECPVKIIGVNNRNLETFETSLKTSSEIISLLPDNLLTVSESGIYKADDISKVHNDGYDAVLIGESLMKTPIDDLNDKISSLYEDVR